MLDVLQSEGVHPVQAHPPLDVVPIVVASMRDAYRCGSRPVALLDHGAGQTYEGVDNPSYAGSAGRDRVALFLAPSERVAMLDVKRYPAAAAVVGCPKLDAVKHLQLADREPEVFTVAWSFHWDNRIVPEARWAFPAFRDSIAAVTAGQPKLRMIGHAHPRAWSDVAPFYELAGIEPVRDFDDVLRRADLFACDNSSAMYEAAFAGVSVLALDAPWYRPHVEHGLRFWSYVPGLKVGHNELLATAIWSALRVPDGGLGRRAARYAYDQPPCAADAAADALREHLADAEPWHEDRRHTIDPYRPKARRLPPMLPERRLRRLGADPAVLFEARLRWVDMDQRDRATEQERLHAMTDHELAEAIADTELAEAVVHG